MLTKKAPLVWEVNGQKIPITKDTVWYHGSPTAKLKAGDVLLPPSKTERLNWTLHGTDPRTLPEGRDMVFITPCIELAIVFAAGPWFYEQLAHEFQGFKAPNPAEGSFVAGAVYAVKPQQPITQDSHRPYAQFRTPKAVVRSITIPAVTEEQVRTAYMRDYRVYAAPELRDAWWVKATALLIAVGLGSGLRADRT